MHARIPGISFNFSFGDDMVLQQSPSKACVNGMLGTGGTAATVKITSTNDDAFVGYSVVASVDDSGGWKACLQPTTLGGEYTLTATCTGCSNTTAATLERVTFGDVWYCGGQSNMALPIQHTLSRNASLAAIMAGKYKNIRIHGISGNMNPNQPWSTLLAAATSSEDPQVSLTLALGFLR